MVKHILSWNRLRTALVLPMLLTLVMPLSFYFGNRSEYYSSLREVALPLMALFMVAVVIMYSLLTFATRWIGVERILSLFIAALGICVWLQGQLMAWDFGPLDGSEIELSQWHVHQVVELGVWLCIITVVVAIGLKWQATSQNVVACGLLAGLLSLLSHAATAPPGPAQTWGETTAHKLHPENNILLIILDTFQSDAFQEILESFSDDVSLFDGFVFYRNALAGYPTTFPSIPLILTGSYYHNRVPIEDFIIAKHKANGIGRRMHDENIGQSYLSNATLRGMEGMEHFDAEIRSMDSILKEEKRRVSHPVLQLLDAGLFRASPTFLKPRVYRNGTWLLSALLSDATVPPGLHGQDILFMKWLVSNLSVDSKNEGEFRFYHFYGAHFPLLMDERQRHSPNMTTTWENYVRQTRGSLKLVRDLLKRLKELDLYNKAEILVVADHGTRVFAPRRRHCKIPWDCYEIEEAAHASALPLFLHKPPGAEGSIEVSDAPITLGDVPCFMSAVAEYYRCSELRHPSSERERRFFYYRWGHEYWDKDYLPEMREYRIKGDAHAAGSWARAGRILAPGNVEILEPIPTVALGEKIVLLKSGEGGKHLPFGWSVAEPHHRWTDGHKAGLQFRVDRKNGRLCDSIKLEMMAHPYLVEGAIDRQEIAVSVNGQYIHEWAMTEGGIYEVKIPADILGATGQAKIGLDIPNAVAPADFGLSKDSRVLGMTVRWFKVTCVN